MPEIGRGCHELRINDKDKTWRIIYRIDPDAIIILHILEINSKNTGFGYKDLQGTTKNLSIGY